MRLGAYPCHLDKDTKAYGAYKKEDISERHRHRFEFNNEYRELLQSKGLVIAGSNVQRDLVEVVEVKGHRWFLGCQFHPEFQSKPDKPHPLFRDFIAATLKVR
jgi:CTP synthase